MAKCRKCGEPATWRLTFTAPREELSGDYCAKHRLGYMRFYDPGEVESAPLSILAPRFWWPAEAEKLGRMLGADKECPVAEFVRSNREADVVGYEQECHVGQPTAICGLCAEMLGHRENSADGLCAIRLRMLVPVLLPDDVEEAEG